MSNINWSLITSWLKPVTPWRGYFCPLLFLLLSTLPLIDYQEGGVRVFLQVWRQGGFWNVEYSFRISSDWHFKSYRRGTASSGKVLNAQFSHENSNCQPDVLPVENMLRKLGLARVNSDKRHDPKSSDSSKMKSRQKTTFLRRILTVTSEVEN